MLHIILLGYLLGWGVAMPLGPINIEIMRRNLQYGVRYGLAIGVGATAADVCYLVLLSTGAIQLLNHPNIIRVVGVIGSLILLWFVYKIFAAKVTTTDKSLKPYTLWHSTSSGFMIAFFSPFNLLFWLSLTSQVANITHGIMNNIILVSIGIIFGAMSWCVTLNLILHFTRHKLSNNVVLWLNRIGGLVLLAFALYGFAHAIF